MFRNKEFRICFMSTAASGIIFTLLMLWFPDYSAPLCICLTIVCLSIFYIAYHITLNKIRLLTDMLNSVHQNVMTLELSGQEEGELGILRSEIHKIISKLQIQTELLSRDKHYLSDAVSDISHQLKTPLTSMNVMIDLLRDPGLPDEKRLSFTSSLTRQLERIEWLVSSLLTMSKIDAGTIIMKKDPVCAAHMMNQAVSHLLIPMELKGIRYEQQVNLDDVTYTGDLRWSAEALSNILKNCMEHSREDGCISVSCEQNSIYTKFTIRDSGEGISPEDLPHIFERFYKGRNSSPDSVGIGLALSSKIIREQNGTVDVDSRVGEYTEFIIKFYDKII